MSGYNGLDYFIIAIFMFSMFVGFSRGLVKEVISLGALILAFVIAAMYSNQLALSFTNSHAVQSVVTEASSNIGVNASQPISYAAIGISYSLIFAGTLVAGSIIGFILNLFFTTGILGTVNRLCGAGFGLIRGFIINLVIIFVAQLTVVGEQQAWHESRLIHQYQPAVIWLNDIVAPEYESFKQKATDTLQNMNGKLQNMTR